MTPEMRAITYENRWRIQRFGTEASIIDPLTLETTCCSGNPLWLTLGFDASTLLGATRNELTM